jgi:hypothetical protein
MNHYTWQGTRQDGTEGRGEGTLSDAIDALEEDWRSLVIHDHDGKLAARLIALSIRVPKE